MLHRMIPGLAAAALLVTFQATAEAQQEGKGTVSAVGMTTLPLQPRLLRVHIDLIGRGKDLKSAIANLRDRRDAARLQLAALKADAKSIKVGPPSRSAEAGQQEQQMRAMIIERTRHHGGAAPTLPTVVTVTAPLTAEWTLAAGDDDARLIAAGELQDKITAADLSGAKDKQALSPEQQEIADEMAQMGNRYGEQQGGRGEPQFLFVADISNQQLDRALAEAFAKAKQQAAQMATAAGGGLGPIRSATKNVSEMNPFLQEYYARRYSPYTMAAMQEKMESNGENGTGNEVLGPDPCHLTYRVAVECTFGLK